MALSLIFGIPDWAGKEGLRFLVKQFGEKTKKVISNRTPVNLFEILDGEEIREHLDSQGFTEKGQTDFEGRAIQPEYCWRRRFTYAEAYEGIPIERNGKGEDTLTNELLSDLEDGGAAVLLGKPGAGKTTASRLVAAQWYKREDTGPVIVHESGGGAVTDPHELTEAIQKKTPNGPVLVLVEDAARHECVRFYETLHELEPDEDVSFLLNSRKREWENFRDRAIHHEAFDGGSEASQTVLETRMRYPEQHEVPPLGEDEVERLVSRFEELTDKRVMASPEELVGQIHAEHGASPMLLLSYHLPIGKSDEPSGEYDSALEENVAKAFEVIATPDSNGISDEVSEANETLSDVALLVNVLNAAGVPLYPELIHSLGEAEGGPDHDLLDSIFSELDGWLLFGRDSDSRWLTHHELWSELYLHRHLDAHNGGAAARKQFERVVNALFRLVDDEDRRDGIVGHLPETVVRLEKFDEHPEAVAKVLAESVFKVCVDRPRLIPLFSTTDGSGIELPVGSSDATRGDCALYRHRAYRTLGKQPLAERELDKMYELAATGEDTRHADGVYYAHKGLVAHAQGDFDAARDYHQCSLDIQRDLGDRAGEADSLGNLGEAARAQGDYEVARDYYQRSLDIKRDLGDRAGEAANLGNLGLVADAQGDYKAARDYHQQSLEIHRELGDRAGEAKSLNNLGSVAQSQGVFEEAREYFQQSLEIHHELGDRAGEAKSLDSLGCVAGMQGNSELAQNYHQQGLEIHRELGDRAGERISLHNLGHDADLQGNHETAREYYTGALSIAVEIGAVHDEFQTLASLVKTCIEADDLDAAHEWCARGIDRTAKVDLPIADQYESQFRQVSTQLTMLSQGTLGCYRSALSTVLKRDPGTAMVGFKTAWNRRDETDPEDDSFEVILAAGVALAAHTTIIELEDGDLAPETILSDVEPHRDRLSKPTTALFEAITSSTDVTPEELLDGVDTDQSIGEADLETLEARAYAFLLSELADNANE